MEGTDGRQRVVTHRVKVETGNGVVFHDGAATLGYLRQGDLRRAWGGVVDFFTVPEALKRKGDQKAYRRYLRNSLKGRLG